MEQPKNRIPIVNMLRGFAALSVTSHHLFHLQPPHWYDPLFSQAMEWGRCGVEVFFVISGFVLPFSLKRSGYAPQDFLRFIWKRAVRILPPSYVALFLLLGMYWMPVWLSGTKVAGVPEYMYEFRSLFANLSLTVPLGDTEWYNGVFWTLSIEFQFYLWIGLVFPLLFSKKIHLLLLLSALVTFLVPQSPDRMYFFQYSTMFYLGVVSFLRLEGLLSRNMAFAHAGVQVLVGCMTIGWLPSLFGLATFLLLSYSRGENKAMNWLGDISYSLYLNHMVVVHVWEAALKRIVDPTGNLPLQGFLALLELSVILGVGYLMYRYVELPILRYSQKISLHAKDRSV